MSGELQTIPARHGVATFVPRGRTIKIINTYGKQVVSAWAISLNAPPEEEESEVGEEEIEEHAEELKQEIEKVQAEEDLSQEEKGKGKGKESEEKGSFSKETESTGNMKETESTSKEDEADDPPEQAPDTPKNEESTETTEKTTGSTEESSGTTDKPSESAEKSNEATEKSSETAQKTQPAKRTWASYLPSMPYRSKAGANKKENEDKANGQDEKSQNEAASKKWSSYLPTGKGFSSYVPNVQLPDSKGVVSAFKSSHNLDPNKSYAEQLYDFSKTPVGAGGIAAATGSGTASSIYAAYNAYVQLNPYKRDQPPMEYLSLPHTRAATHRLVPEINDTLLTNLRNPIMTLVEDTTPGAHDTLTAACDANLYAALGVDKPEEHGSCAENLVLALKQLNEKAGLKGAKSIGADITVNIAPTPLHLFMNTPIEFGENAQSEDGSGAKGATLKVDEPKGKKRSFVRFKAERDIVIVLSACPMDVGPQNGGRCMAANFIVEEASEDLSASKSSLKKEKSTPKKFAQGDKRGELKKEQPVAKPKVENRVDARRDSAADDPPESELPEEHKEKDRKPKVDVPAEEAPKPKRKPKKLERRSGSNATQTKTLSS